MKKGRKRKKERISGQNYIEGKNEDRRLSAKIINRFDRIRLREEVERLRKEMK